MALMKTAAMYAVVGLMLGLWLAAVYLSVH
jgi:hypothetical protein